MIKTSFTLAKDELKMLDVLARVYRISRSATLRMIIRHAHERHCLHLLKQRQER